MLPTHSASTWRPRRSWPVKLMLEWISVLATAKQWVCPMMWTCSVCPENLDEPEGNLWHAIADGEGGGADAPEVAPYMCGGGLASSG